jgi:hypothetical protein
LYLSICDLAHASCLHLTVTNLAHSAATLDLSVADLLHRNSGHLDLSVADLTNLRGDAWLTVGGLRRGWRGRRCSDDFDVDGRALGRPRSVVQVVEPAGVALVPDRGAAESQCSVAANGETGRVDRASLRSVKRQSLCGFCWFFDKGLRELTCGGPSNWNW